MRLSHPLAIKSSALALSWVVRGWLGTLQYHEVGDRFLVEPRHARRPMLYLFWHEALLIPAWAYARQGVAALISQHRDGELIAQVVRMLRGVCIRGSTTRGGASAVRQMLRRGAARHLAITPDGPRGPRRVVQPGAVFVASQCGMPIVPVGIGVSRCWRARSWDRFMLPMPGANAWLVGGMPIELARECERDELERERARVQAALDSVQAQAEALARGR